MQSITEPRQEPTPPNATAINTSRLRTVTGSRWPRSCACGCGHAIPRDPEVRYVVDFGAPKPYPAYLREHSPDFGTFRGRARETPDKEFPAVPGFKTGTGVLRESAATREREVAHEDAEATATPEAGRAWASGQLVFNAGQFESARSGFADYARDGETAAQLRTRVNRVILEDLEQKVIALRALHARMRALDGGESFGDVVARGRPRARGECVD